MRVVRHWSIRHAKGLNRLYRIFEILVLRGLNPLWRRVGYRRLERPVAATERAIKGFLFDCQMCGQCTLTYTGMSCPMNCPKTLRNGPCGGVRPDGQCEVDPGMRCVWVGAWDGAQRMGKEAPLMDVLDAVDHGQRGASSWVKVARDGDLGALVPLKKGADAE